VVGALSREIGPKTTADPLTVSDREGELAHWLASRAVARDWVIGPVLAAHDVDVVWCERLAAALDGPALQVGLEWVASTLTVEALISDIQQSTSRVSAYVAAMKSYSQMDRATLQRIDVTEGIDSTLVVLGHRMQNITVVRRYGADVPEIDAYAGELNQVWTNLVDNAVDAMDGYGTLTVTTRSSGDFVVVEIADTGVGMPPDVAAHAFDAFFTTKGASTGIGFGLDIARRVVVDKHGGSIAIDSEPGNTVIRVMLPSHPPRT
jgi:signal transduction histidine kinase